MDKIKSFSAATGGIWERLRQEAAAAATVEPALEGLLGGMIMERDSLGEALGHLLGRKLGDEAVSAAAIRELCVEALRSDPAMIDHYMRDMAASHERDPACRSWLQPFLFFKGVAALQAHRIAHWLWHQERQLMAFHIQSRCSEIFQVDIHPAALIGSGIFLDHATGTVIGETSVVGDDVSMLQSVTLGGNGKERGDRHPKIGRGVLISSGAKVLGNIRVGDEARIAAGSVVLHDVPPCVTVAGVPAKIVRVPSPEHPAECMDHSFDL
ncbi:MAG: serine O-acetyltransferase [Alphaproteobacteria bacterium]